MSRRIAVERCPACQTWWRMEFTLSNGRWYCGCPLCGDVLWRARVQLIDVAALTISQQEAVKRRLRTTRIKQ